MNCTKAEQLIPLDAGGDLQPPEADSVRQHIEACAHCQQIAEEFAASQAWLSEFATPNFDEAVLADLRASVHREIAQMESAGEATDRKTWFGWLLPQWSPRFAVAAAVALLIVIGGLAVSIYRHKTPTQEVVIKDQPPKPSATPAGGNSVSDLPGKLQTANETPRSPHRNHRLNQPVQVPQQFIPEVPAPTGVTAQANPGVEPTTDPARTTDVAKAEPEMLRIEFQTADPNIRIIWLTPKDSGASANKPNPNTR